MTGKRKIEARRWFQQAGYDLQATRWNILHYIPSRYPNGIPSGYPHEFYGKKIAEQALASAEKILSAIQDFFTAKGEKEILE